MVYNSKSDIADIRVEANRRDCLEETALDASCNNLSFNEKETMTTMMTMITPDCQNCSPKEIYIRFLQSLYLIYSALEHELLRCADDVISFPFSEVLFPEELFRRSSLAHDLTYFMGIGWKSQITSTRATDAYVARIKEVAETDPDLLLAHYSARHIGDLQSCEKSLEQTRRLFSLPSDSGAGDLSSGFQIPVGVAFHVFDQIEDKDLFRHRFFDTIRGFNISPEVNKKMAKECKLVYQLNLNVYWELRNLISKTEKGTELYLGSKVQSSDSFGGGRSHESDHALRRPLSYLNREPIEKISPSMLTKQPTRCRGFSRVASGVIFWLAIWFICGFILWESEWAANVNIDDIPILKAARNKIHEFYTAMNSVMSKRMPSRLS